MTTVTEPEVYTCPQCGPAPEGADEHAARYHTIGFDEPLDEQLGVQGDEPDVVEPAPAPKKRPGPAPNPNSARQRKLAKKAAPARKSRPNTRASSSPAPAPADNAYLAGARTILGWVAQPLAVAGIAMHGAAAAMPRINGEPSKRALDLARKAEALSLDSLTIAVHGEPIARVAAGMADNIPWMAATLEKAGQIAPYADGFQALAGVVLQVMCNHGLVPASRMLGTLTPEELRAAAGLADEPLD